MTNSLFNIAIALAILLGSLCCSPKQPLFNMSLPEKLSFPQGKVLRIKDGPNSGILIFQNGIVHLGPNPKASFQMDTSSFFRWGLIHVDQKTIKDQLLIFVSYPRNSGDPFRPIYDLDSIRIDFEHFTLYNYGSRSSSFIKVDTIDYQFPIESVLLFKKLKKNSQTTPRND